MVQLTFRTCIAVALALLAGVFHSWHLNSLHENDTFFSHLSEPERELTFATEMGFYYSFFKQLIWAPSFVAGASSLLRDNLIEWPNDLFRPNATGVNDIQRFNIYPEMLLAAAYRTLNASSLLSSTCYVVSREIASDAGEVSVVDPLQIDRLSVHHLNVVKWPLARTVTNCMGLQQPTVFYTRAVFALNALTTFGLGLSAYFLGDESLLALLLAEASFFALHSSATRVQWSPPLRESFSYPFFLLQQCLMVAYVRQKSDSRLLSVFFTVSQVLFQLPWQFSQFALITQTVAIFIAFLATSGLGNSDVLGRLRGRLVTVLVGQLISTVLSFALQLGNTLILTSAYPVVLIAALIGVAAGAPGSLVRKIGAFTGSGGVIFMAMKFLLDTDSSDGRHIFDMLRIKLLPWRAHIYRSFHTQLYLCSAVFDFMPFGDLVATCHSLVLPLAIIAVMLWLLSFVWAALRDRKTTLPDEEIVKHYVCAQAVLQFLAFTCMALLIMRLRLFWVPQMCTLVGMLASALKLPSRRTLHSVLLVALAAVCFKAKSNLDTELSHYGEFSDLTSEALNTYLARIPPSGDGSPWIISGSMSSLGVLRTTLMVEPRTRAVFGITNHPHYENSELRERTILAYSIYSAQALKDVWQIYRKDLRADFVLVNYQWCRPHPWPHCAIKELYQLLQPPRNLGKAICELMHLSQPVGRQRLLEPFFYEVFQDKNRLTVLLRVNPNL